MIQVIHGDVREVLDTFPNEHFDCVVTSPPYWGLRDYGLPDVDWSDWKGSLGLEPTFQLYIQHLQQIFNEVKRVLKKTGTCWVNLGDSYVGATSQHKNNGSFGAGSCISKKKTQGASLEMGVKKAIII